MKPVVLLFFLSLFSVSSFAGLTDHLVPLNIFHLDGSKLITGGENKILTVVTESLPQHVGQYRLEFYDLQNQKKISIVDDDKNQSSEKQFLISPDNKYFVADNRVYEVSSGDGDIFYEKADIRGVQWSPDSRYLSLFKSLYNGGHIKDYDFSIVDHENSNSVVYHLELKIVDGDRNDSKFARWSLDGKRIAISYTSGITNQAGSSESIVQNRFFVVNLSLGKIEFDLTSNEIPGTSFELSPDGRYVLFNSFYPMILDLSKSPEKSIIFKQDVQSSNHIFYPHWSKDGRFLWGQTFVGTDDYGYGQKTNIAYINPFDKNTKNYVKQFKLDVLYSQNGPDNFSFSPNEKYIIYYHYDFKTKLEEVRLFDTTSSKIIGAFSMKLWMNTSTMDDWFRGPIPPAWLNDNTILFKGDGGYLLKLEQTVNAQ